MDKRQSGNLQLLHALQERVRIQNRLIATSQEAINDLERLNERRMNEIMQVEKRLGRLENKTSGYVPDIVDVENSLVYQRASKEKKRLMRLEQKTQVNQSTTSSTY